MKQFPTEITHRFPAWDKLDLGGDTYRPWVNSGYNIKISAKGTLGWCQGKHHKPRF